MERVLVTGGAGYIGSHAVLALADAGYQVTVIDNLVTGFREAVDNRAAFIEGNVGDSDLVASVLRRHDIEAIMHFAGSVVVPESVADPLKYYRNNTAVSRNLIESAVDCGIRHFIFSSTAATYGAPATRRVNEQSETVPINPYGWSKLMTERMLADVAIATGLTHCILRYFNVAGADPQGRAGQSTKGATHLIKVAIEAACGRRDGVSIFGSDFDTHDGTGVRDYIHVSDLASAHVRALEKLSATQGESFTLNCGYGRGYSVLEVLDAIERVSGVFIERRFEERRAGDPAELVADNEAILSILGWTPQRQAIETIVADALAWERKLPAMLSRRA